MMRTYPDEEVDHEEDVEREVDLLGGAVRPLLTRFHRLTALTSTQTYTLITRNPAVARKGRPFLRYGD